MQYIDLRSDTVTQPTPAMREAMARAQVGDDVYGEDPTVNQLQELAAAMLGKEAALFVPSGTMGNLSAALAHCGRGDEIILGSRSHTFLYEAGGIAALGGVHPFPLAEQPNGELPLEAIEAAIRRQDDHYPISRLLILENTHNRCGGAALTPQYIQSASDLVHQRGLALHIDGARIFNAASALGITARELAATADTLTFCLSKGLCAPVGSLLCGSENLIRAARRIRKQLGGGMRQAGILAAAGVVALETMVERLVEDHARARRLAERLAALPGFQVEGVPASNMVYVQIDPQVPQAAAQISAALKAHGLLVGVVGARRFRMVVHYWIDDSAIQQTVSAFEAVLEDIADPQ